MGAPRDYSYNIPFIGVTGWGLTFFAEGILTPRSGARPASGRIDGLWEVAPVGEWVSCPIMSPYFPVSVFPSRASLSVEGNALARETKRELETSPYFEGSLCSA